MVSSQKRRPLDHEVGHKPIVFTQNTFIYIRPNSTLTMEAACYFEMPVPPTTLYDAKTQKATNMNDPY
jgi:hypothetical protein